MRIQQLRDVLEYVAKCRRDMAQLYTRLINHADSARVKMMLEYFASHQKYMAEKLNDYLGEASERTLDTWYKDFVFEDFTQRCQDTLLPANMNEEDVLDLHLDLENRLIALLEKTEKSTSAEDARSALANLIRVEKTQQQRLVHSTIRMDDI